MKKILYAVLTGLGLIVGFSGCSEEVKPKPFTYTQLLTGTSSKSWQLTNVQVVENGQAGRANLDRCIMDDVYTFYANEEKLMEVTEGASKCNAADPDIVVQDSWSYASGTATLSFVLPLLTDEFAIPFIVKTLNENTLTVELYFEEENISYRFTFTALKE